MASVSIAQVKKRFGSVEILHGVDIAIPDGSFTVLVGPSGCGKSTLLRMIAGLEEISDGEVRIGAQRVNELPPKQRDIAMVFQNYALYPHMTVYDNMAFSLMLAKLNAATITAKVSFTVDARSQGNGPVELRRFDTGSQVDLPLTQTARGIWKTDIDLPLFREIKFKFGSDGPGAKNSGYEGPGQGDRSYVVGTAGGAYSGTYDFIDSPAPVTVIEGQVTGGGATLAGALVEATTANPNLNYALSFSDGSYTLFAPAGAQTLRASRDGFEPATRAATSGPSTTGSERTPCWRSPSSALKSFSVMMPCAPKA